MIRVMPTIEASCSLARVQSLRVSCYDYHVAPHVVLVELVHALVTFVPHSLVPVDLGD